MFQGEVLDESVQADYATTISAQSGRAPSALTLWILVSLLCIPPAYSVVPPQGPVASKLPGSIRADARIPGPAATPAYEPGQIIVKFNSSLSECAHCLLAKRKAFATALSDGSSSLDELNRKHRVSGGRSVFMDRGSSTTAEAQATQAQLRQEVKRRFRKRSGRAPMNPTEPDLSSIYVLNVPADADVEAISREYAADPHVEYAQPNYLIKAASTPNDPYFNSSNSWGQGYDDQWGLKRIKAPEAWDVTQGQGVTVAVVDSGVDYAHPDIAANVVPGRNLVDNTSDPLDDFGHGTHVAGTIAAVGNNSLGIVGVAPNAKIMPVKALDSSGSGPSDRLAAAIVYAAQNGADIINNSWGCAGPCVSDPVVEDAVRTAYGLGAVIVFAAGNNLLNVLNRSPQNMTDSKPIVVAASTESDAAAHFSDYGILVDVMAPGGGDPAEPGREVNILSLRAGVCDPALCDPSLLVGDRYLRLQGTSMAAAHVAGAAALLLSHRPGLTNEEVRQTLRAAADAVDQQWFFRGGTGGGRLNIARALQTESGVQAAISAPSPFSSFDPTTIRSLHIRGTAGGPAFQQYQLFYSRQFANPYAPLGPAPGNWVPVASSVSTPVSNGSLGTLRLHGLEAGLYTLKLVCLPASGAQFEAFGQFAIEYRLRRVSIPPAFDLFPAVAGSRIVWTHTYNDPNKRFFGSATPFHGDIYLHDLATGAQRAITNTGLAEFPAISGDRIVWVDYRTDPAGDIYMYDLRTNTERAIAVGPALQQQPSVAGDKVIWLQRDAIGDVTDYSIYLADLAAGTTRRLTTDSAVPIVLSWSNSIAISGDRVIWVDARYGWQAIFVHDLTSNAERWISTGSLFVPPAISGDRIVWNVSGSGGFEIIIWDLATSTVRPIVTAPAVAILPRISGDRVVWADYRNDSYNGDAYAYDLRSNTEQQITSQTLGQAYCDISGNTVVWMDDRDGSHIYVYEFPAGELPRLPRTVPRRPRTVPWR